jgi:hypothetical protein
MFLVPGGEKNMTKPLKVHAGLTAVASDGGPSCKVRRRWATPLLAMLFFWFAPAPVWAYIDPGGGFVLWQGLIAAAGAVIVFARRPWAAIKRWIDRLRNR